MTSMAPAAASQRGAPLDPREIFFTARLDGVCAKLLAAIREPSGLTLLIGEEGVGKTTLLAKLRWYLRPTEIPLVAATAATSIDDIRRACADALKIPAGSPDGSASPKTLAARAA